MGVRAETGGMGVEREDVDGACGAGRSAVRERVDG